MRHRRRRRRDGGGGGGVGKTALEAQCRWCRSPRPMQSPTARTVNETPRRQRSSRAVCWFAWSTRRAHAVRSAHTLMAFSRCRSAKRASKRERCKRARELPRPSHENTQCATRSSMYESDAARGREGDEASRRSSRSSSSGWWSAAGERETERETERPRGGGAELRHYSGQAKAPSPPAAIESAHRIGATMGGSRPQVLSSAARRHIDCMRWYDT